MKIIPSSRRHHYVASVSVLLIVLALIIGIVGYVQPTPSEDAVTFTDPNLETAVREAIAILDGPIYPSELDGLTSPT